ncbi:MAG TPA: YdeI/OmpD-associated family protein [Anaerolineales bacterium]|nr:YdeI/OmpD-associated family protein [Anaerolineales bacterium]
MEPDQTFEFYATVMSPDAHGAFVEIPAEIASALGNQRVKVFAWFDSVPYRGSVVRMGGSLILGVRKDILLKNEKKIGDTLLVKLKRDSEPRIVEIPNDVKVELEQQPETMTSFNKLSYTHQKEWINSILEAKRPETRQQRVKKMIKFLSEKMI